MAIEVVMRGRSTDYETGGLDFALKLAQGEKSKVNNRAIGRLGIATVILHALIAAPHGVAHSNLHIDMEPWQNAYILLVITLLPLAAAILIWKRPSIGFLLLLISMIGSLLFGGFYHFLIPGPDNVGSLGNHPWTYTFQLSAVLLALTEIAGVVAGVIGIRSTQ